MDDDFEPMHLFSPFCVRLAGFEPATPGVETLCSIQLSYRRERNRECPFPFTVLYSPYSKTTLNFKSPKDLLVLPQHQSMAEQEQLLLL